MKAVSRPEDRYIEEVLENVFASRQDRERLEADLRAHFTEGEARGEAPRQVIAELGEPQHVAAAFNAEHEIRYAGFWKRLFAFAGDFGVLFALLIVPLSLFVLVAATASEQPNPSLPAMVAIGLVAVAAAGIAILYFPILEARFGTTPGKHWLRLRVIREDGGPIGPGQAFLRRLSLYFEILVLDALFIPFTAKRQRAFDIVAKTVVAQEPGEETPGWAWALCLVLPAAMLTLVMGVLFLASRI
jgi:uncharacterized RDD family membrane protein YckC